MALFRIMSSIVEHKNDVKGKVKRITNINMNSYSTLENTYSRSTNSPFPWPSFSQFPAQSALSPSSALSAPLKWWHGHSTIAHCANQIIWASSIIHSNGLLESRDGAELRAVSLHNSLSLSFSIHVCGHITKHDSLCVTQVLTKLPMVHRLHLRVSLIPDVIVNGLPHWFVVLEADVRVPEDLCTNAAGLGANWCPIPRSAKGQGILKQNRSSYA